MATTLNAGGRTSSASTSVSAPSGLAKQTRRTLRMLRESGRVPSSISSECTIIVVSGCSPPPSSRPPPAR
eukprot:5443356-Prymnesium_polylepis.3